MKKLKSKESTQTESIEKSLILKERKWFSIKTTTEHTNKKNCSEVFEAEPHDAQKKHASTQQNDTSETKHNKKVKTAATVVITALGFAVITLLIVLACLKTEPSAFSQFCTTSLAFIKLIGDLLNAL